MPRAPQALGADPLLFAAMLALAPVLVWQGRRVRRIALALPEAAGPRAGRLGTQDRPLRLLIVGDSAAAGVGAAEQSEALAGRLVQALAAQPGGEGRGVSWRLVARSGVDTAAAIALLDDAWRESGQTLAAEVAVIGLGVNDVTGQVPLARWLQRMDRLAERLVRRHAVRLIVVSGLPPMHRFPLLPQPLRWYLGRRARAFDRALRAWAGRRADTVHAPMPAIADPAAMAEDGFHPGPRAYRAWGEALAATITDRRTGSP